MFSKIVSTFAALAVVACTGCAYRLPAITPAVQEHIRLVADSPAQYRVLVHLDTSTEVQIPQDGKIAIDIPAYRRSCGVYLFNQIKVGGYDDPLKVWSVAVTRGGNPLRKLSIRAVNELPTDAAGYHVLKLQE